MKFGIDTSFWDADPTRLTDSAWNIIAPLLDFVIVRIGFGINDDTKATMHIDRAKQRGIPYAGYWWIDPTKTLSTQITKIISRAKELGVCALFTDNEQWWSDWASIEKGDYITPLKTKFTDSYLNTYYKNTYDTVKASLTIPVGNYCADWFINDYAPSMKSWVETSNYWQARYCRWYEPVWWAEQKKLLGTNYPAIKLKELASKIVLYNGSIIRQFESLTDAAGLPHNLDLDVMQNDSEYYRIFKNTVVPPPPPPPLPPPPATMLYRVTEALRIRQQPSATSVITGYLNLGQIVSVIELVNTGAGGIWAKLVSGGYCSAAYLVKQV